MKVEIAGTPPPTFDYSLANSGGISVQQGSPGTNTITAALTNGTAQAVALSCVASSLPADASCSFNPSSVTPSSMGATSELIVHTTSGTPTGSFQVQVTGSPPGTTRTTFTLTVTAPPPPFDYTLSVNPPTVTVTAGVSGSVRITVSTANGFTGTVAITQNGGSPCSLSHASVLLTSSTTSDYVTLSCTYPNAGINTVTVIGTSGSLSHPVMVSFNVQSVTTTGCGTGCTVSITSDATISNVVASSTSISFTAISQGGATAFANITISKLSVPNLSALQVSLDGTPITPSIASSSTDYFIYFIFAASNPAPIEIRFAAAPENAPSLIFGIPSTIFTAVVGAVAAIVSALIGLVYRAKSRTKN